MKRSLRPIKVKDPRTYDFHRTFGGVDVSTIPTEFNMDYMGQQGIFPDQVEDRFPEACTAYTVTGNASNDDNVNYDDKNFTYTKTKLMMGVEGDVPCDQMTAMKSGTVYGVRKKGQGDADALGNRRAPYFIVKKLNGSYWEGIISALWKKQGTLNCGSYWPQAFENIGRDGIIPPFTVPTDWNEGHNWEACGIKILQGEPRLIVKSWQGVHYGDGGYCYLTKSQVETLFTGNGFGIFGQKHASPEDIRTVKINVIETLINFLLQLVARLQGQ